MGGQPNLASGFVTDRLIHDLTKSIRDGRLAIGTRICSEVALARQYKISVISVRRALAQLTASGWVHRVRGKGTFIRHVGEPCLEEKFRRAAAVSAIFYSPLLMEKSATPYMWFLSQRSLQGAVQRAMALGIDLAVRYMTAGYEQHIYDSYPFENIPGDGLIFFSFDVTTKSAERLAAQRRPIVLADPTELNSNFTNVTQDLRPAIIAGVRHLVALGHREIGWLEGDPRREWKPHTLTRRQYFLEGMQSENLEVRPEFIINAGSDAKSSCEAVGRLLATGQRPTAFMAQNDDRALGACNALRAHGLSIPEDIAIIGCDDAPFAETMDPPLTTIRTPRTEIGVEAVNLIVAALGGKSSDVLTKYLPPELVVRESCGWKAANKTPAGVG
jgi:DNA-binding LacI/PurR family transcriptional regulator